MNNIYNLCIYMYIVYCVSIIYLCIYPYTLPSSRDLYLSIYLCRLCQSMHFKLFIISLSIHSIYLSIYLFNYLSLEAGWPLRRPQQAASAFMNIVKHSFIHIFTKKNTSKNVVLDAWPSYEVIVIDLFELK